MVPRLFANFVPSPDEVVTLGASSNSGRDIRGGRRSDRASESTLPRISSVVALCPAGWGLGFALSDVPRARGTSLASSTVRRN
jgi:hypothetical protein